MARALLTLGNGTQVQIEGSVEEVRSLLDFYNSPKVGSTKAEGVLATNKSKGKRAKSAGESGSRPPEDTKLDLTEIISAIKNCSDSEQIEKNILDRTSQVDRTLLPLYMVHEHFNNSFGLSSGEVSRITIDLGVPVSQPNASRCLSGTASKYVIGDKVRKKGQQVRYKLSRRGLQYMKAVVKGTSQNDKE